MAINLDLLGVLTLLAALGFIGNSYAFYGRSQGWPVSDLFSGGERNRLTLTKASAVFVPLTFGFAWYEYGFLIGLGVLVGGFALAMVLTTVLRQHVQWLWYLALVGLLAYGIFKNAHKFT
jgi:hypothetical protein